MASIKFLNNITLVGNQLELARMQNLNAAPTAYGDGQLYYDSSLNKLRLRENGAWVNVTTGADDDTTYDLSGFGTSNGTAGIELDGSDGSLDQVTIQGANGTTVTRATGTDILTVTGATINNSTITLTAGTGLSTGGNFTLNQASNKEITFDVDYLGSDNIILSAGNEEGNSIDTDDVVMYSDTDDSGNVKYGLISDLPFTNNQGDVTGIDAGTYITVDDPNTATPTVNADGTTAATADKLVARDASGFAYAATPTSGDSSTKLATTAFVQTTLVGQLEFKGGFNASTGAIDSGGNLTSGNSRVAIAVGDMYVVSTAGNFFGNAATPLTNGDSVIVQEAAAVGDSVEADFIIVQSDTDLATLTTVGIGNVDNNGSGTTVSYNAGTATIDNSDKGSSQFIFKTIAASGQTDITADSNSDTLTFAGGGATSITTNATSDTVTISSVNTQYAAATSTVLGLMKLSSDTEQTTAANSVTSTASRTYGVQFNSSDQAVVNVPWTDESGPVDDVTAMTTNNRKGIDVSPTTGNVEVGLSFGSLSASTTVADDDEFLAHDDSANANVKFTASAINTYIGDKRTFANTGPASAGTTYTINANTHGLGNDSTLISVSLIEVSTGNTTYADINRGASGLITISFAVSQGVDSIKALLSLHG